MTLAALPLSTLLTATYIIMTIQCGVIAYALWRVWRTRTVNSPHLTPRRIKVTVKLTDDVIRFTRRSERSLAKETSLLRDEYPTAKHINVTEVTT